MAHMALYLPDGSLHIGTEYDDLAKRIQLGDGVSWSGDPRLYLQVGVVTATDEFGRTRTGRRLEVMRWNEDGSETLVGHWRPDEQHQICIDLAKMRAGAEGRISGVDDRLDQHNDALEERYSQEYREHMTQLLDHAARIHAEQNGPRSTFFLGGRDAARA